MLFGSAQPHMLSFEMHIQYLYVPSLSAPPPTSHTHTHTNTLVSLTPFVSLLSLYSVPPAENCTQESGASESVVNVICFELGEM